MAIEDDLRKNLSRRLQGAWQALAGQGNIADNQRGAPQASFRGEHPQALLIES